MRPLPSPPTSASLQVVESSDSARFVWPQDTSAYSTPSTAQTFVVRLPIGVEPPKPSSGAPRLLKARRREGRIFTHTPSSSMSSLDSASSCSIITAEFWLPPQTIAAIPMEDETKITPPTTPMPKTKFKSKPANIIIPRNTSSIAAVSPTYPTSPPLPTPVPSPTNTPEAVLCTPLSPLFPLSPNRRIPTPNTRIRKLAKLTRTLGENVPIELVFPSGNPSSAPSSVTPAPAPKPTKRAKMLALPRVSPSGPRPTTRPRPAASPQWPLTPTPDCTMNVEAHTKTAVGLHYALGMNSFPTRAVALVRAIPTVPTSPPPFSNVFTMDDVSWERARLAVMGPRATKKAKRMLGGVHKAPAEVNGRGTWRKKENTWSGEWNVEDMEELQVQLRRLRRR